MYLGRDGRGGKGIPCNRYDMKGSCLALSVPHVSVACVTQQFGVVT